MTEMALKIQTLWPEIVLTGVAFAVMVTGLSPSEALRRATYPISAAALILAAILAAASPAMGIDHAGPLSVFMKVAICLIGLALLATVAELPHEASTPEERAQARAGGAFDPGIASRGEFYGFFLLSLVGAMLCAGAEDVIWLFLALELTSLPTYVMVAMSRPNIRAPEAAVKYFFLGALAAAIFLYGFALLYGATGTTTLEGMREVFTEQGLSPLAIAGMLLAIIGVCFKIAAVPMHFYAADVYQGAATPVAAFLAFVPKAAGFVTLILLLGTVGWPLNRPEIGLPGDLLVYLLWVLAVATMFIGNTIALRQNSVKRVLAYSSIAHSGYMLVGLVAGLGPAAADGEVTIWVRNGIAAVLFYLVAYGVMNLGAFAVLGVLRRSGEEADTFEDLNGLAERRPAMAAAMAVCVLSLIGLPPLVGFFGKLFILGAAISAGFYVLAALLVLNSAIAAYYYLRIVGACYLAAPEELTEAPALPNRSLAAGASAVLVIVLSLGVAPLLWAALGATAGIEPASPAAEARAAAAESPAVQLDEPYNDDPRR